MKKTLTAISMLLVLMMVLAGCGSGGEKGLSMVINDDNTGVITANRASAGDTLTAGALSLQAEDTLYIEPALEGKTAINIKLIPTITEGPDAEAEELMHAMDPENAVMDIDIEGTEPVECSVGAGDYYVCVTMASKGTGTIALRVGSQPTPWTLAPAADEAAAGAGLDSFEVPDGVETSLGLVSPSSFGYQEGVAEADISTGAVEMRARKGLKAAFPDVSFDENEYQYQWSREIGAVTVKCYGNRDGEATKTVWSDGDYTYALLAYGAGGDDDYGLPVEDLDSLVEAVK